MDTPTRYTVELRLPQAGCADIQEAAARARAATEGGPVRFVRSIFVPEDETCFHVLEGPSREAVAETASRAGISTPRISRAVP